MQSLTLSNRMPRSQYTPVHLEKLYLALWACVLLVTPFYTLPSGLPQIADFLMAGLSVLLLVMCGLHFKRTELQAVGLLTAFVVYVFLLSFSWALLLNDPTILVHSFYYFFNFVVFCTVLTLHTLFGHKFILTTLWSIVASIFSQVLLAVMLFDASSFRQSLTFNNPNQLGYYTILCGCLLAVITQRFYIKRLVLITAYFGVFLLTVLSLSKAAILGTVMLMLFVLVKKPIVLFCIFGLLIAASYGTNIGDVLGGNLRERVGSIGQTDDSLAGRGYDRIINHPGYLIMGAGEGAYDRYNSLNAGNELHSSVGTLIFSYGLFGTLIFICFLTQVVKGAGLSIVTPFLPILLYSLTHQGLRFTTLWIFLSIVMCVIRTPYHLSTINQENPSSALTRQ